ncbi:MAG: hypothetical protein J6S67_25210 [Methanobrevibacter sp.]|nr:hypothetical protein [Methanobrevibacter sp.]
MPNSFDGNGLQVMTQREVVEDLTQDFQNIYGEDINVDSNSPDGQIINILAQCIEDNYELLSQVYTSFDPDQAIGNVLDQRCAINGVQRKAGTYTYVVIDVTCDRSVTLPGLDQNSVDDSYTVSDSEGNQFVLVTTSPISTGSNSLVFRAKNIGQVEVLPNTINTPVTVVLGVTELNNPGAATEVGKNEETDAELRERRKRSVSISNVGYVEGMQAALENIYDVTRASVFQNRTNVTDQYGIPGHSVWVIVQGGTDAEIGEVLDAKMAPGIGMKGAQTVVVPQADGSVETYNFDRPTPELLYVTLDITPLNGQAIDPDYIKGQVASMSFNPYETVDSSSIICYTKSIQDNIALTCQISTDGTTWETVATPSNLDKYFYITTASITINDMSES